MLKFIYMMSFFKIAITLLRQYIFRAVFAEKRQTYIVDAAVSLLSWLMFVSSLSVYRWERCGGLHMTNVCYISV